jgi:hypothetical protein
MYKKIKKEPRHLKRRKDSPQREATNKTYALEQTLKPIQSILQEVSSEEYLSTLQK